MIRTFKTLCVLSSGYLVTGIIIDAPVKKEIRWQLFEIKGIEGAMSSVSTQGQLEFIDEIFRRGDLIINLSQWLHLPLYKRLTTKIPRNNLCDYV